MELLVSKGKIHLTSLFHSTVLISLFPYLALIVVTGEKQLLGGHSLQSMSCVPRSRAWAHREMGEDNPAPQMVCPKLWISELVGAGRKGSCRREQVQASRGDSKKRRMSEILAHWHDFCYLIWREKKPNCFNSVSVSVSAGRYVKFTQFFVLSNTYLNSHICNVLCSDINWFFSQRISTFFQLHSDSSNAKILVNYNMLNLIRQSL